MLFDLNNPLEEENFKLACNRLYGVKHTNGRRAVVELTEKCGRTLSQNAYIHVMFAYFGAMYGCSAEEVKQDFFKEVVNPDVFLLGYREDRITGRKKALLRSLASISKEDMGKCIDRFLHWSAEVAGIYLPRADEKDKVAMCEIEARKCQQYMFGR